MAATPPKKARTFDDGEKGEKKIIDSQKLLETALKEGNSLSVGALVEVMSSALSQAHGSGSDAQGWDMETLVAEAEKVAELIKEKVGAQACYNSYNSD
jgi:hypothetical protein